MKLRNKKRTIGKFKILFTVIVLLIVYMIFFGRDKIYADIVQAIQSVVALSGDTTAIDKNVNNLNYTKDSKENIIQQEEKREDIDQNKEYDWNLLLVNPWNKLPEGFSIKRTSFKNGHSVDERVFSDLEKMLDDAYDKGLSPIICSSFRTMEKQESLFKKKVDKYILQGYSKEDAEVEAAKWVAVPGTSEHQTGLAVDIVALDYQILDKNQENTEEQKWLMENSYKYGFILRYPLDKSEITGIEYEPWHYRYVGKEVAKEIYEKGLSLEEYLVMDK